MWLKKHSTRGFIGALVIAAATVAAALVLFVNRQAVVDNIIAWQYQPTAAIKTLVERADMSDIGTFYFYASQPALENAENFTTSCTKKEESTAILGCYDGRRIYIYNVTDKRIDGIRTVTAAHEMLHAAYDRMSESERTSLRKLLEVEFQKLKNDKRFAERMKIYDRTEPGQKYNELHSIVGTEVSAISSALEDHYKKYFDDRTKVVTLHAAYESIFKQLQERSDELVAELKTLAEKIEANTNAYNSRVQALDGAIADFNRRAENGGFRSQTQFDSERAALVSQVNTLNNFRGTINTDIQQYKRLQSELATIASESEELNRSIDSSLAPAPRL